MFFPEVHLHRSSLNPAEMIIIPETPAHTIHHAEQCAGVAITARSTGESCALEKQSFLYSLSERLTGKTTLIIRPHQISQVLAL
jgi:hypothetical protein